MISELSGEVSVHFVWLILSSDLVRPEKAVAWSSLRGSHEICSYSNSAIIAWSNQKLLPPTALSSAFWIHDFIVLTSVCLITFKSQSTTGSFSVKTQTPVTSTSHKGLALPIHFWQPLYTPKRFLGLAVCGNTGSGVNAPYLGFAIEGAR